MFSVDSPTAVRGVDKLIPVDVYLPGCPPRPEAIIDAIIKLRKKVSNEALQERGMLQQSHRYHTVSHGMKVVAPILTGQYLQTEARQVPPKELVEAMGMPIPPALQSAAQQQEEVKRG
jgi:NAD(P)H-quinone oxidoreductase subunit K